MDDYRVPPVCKVKNRNSDVEIQWKDYPKRILLIHKFFDDDVFPSVVELAKFVLETWRTCVLFVDSTFPELVRCGVYDSELHNYLVCCSPDQYSTLKLPKGKFPAPPVLPVDEVIGSKSCLSIFESSVADNVDLIVCLGGDGTMLQISSMFQSVVPPVIGFALGTLCFLNPFVFDSYRTNMKWVMDGSPTCLLRSRLLCRVVRGGSTPEESDRHRPTAPGLCLAPTSDLEYHCLNQLVIDRGDSASVCDLTIKVNGRKVTSIEGDGLIVSTSTGSTAYSMSAGGSILHPSIPAYILTTICSLTLNSRAIVLPSNLPMEIGITPNSRHSAAHFSFDGRSRLTNIIHPGDSIHVLASPYPVPSIVPMNQSTDWFCRLTRLVKWNMRRGGGGTLTQSTNTSEHHAE